MQYIEAKDRKVYNIDFDGTLTTGEYTDDPNNHIDIIDRVRELYFSGHIIIIWSARLWTDASWMISWLIKNEVPFHGVMMGKGGTDYYVDDKAITLENFIKE